jgi:hypothetical protein
VAIQASIKTVGALCVDDLVDSGSFLSTQVSACDYGVLDTKAGCAIVVQPQSSTTTWATWNTAQFNWGLRLECFIQDTGNPVQVLTRVWDIQDAVIGAILAGSNLNTAHRSARPVALDRPADTFVEFAGHDYVPVYVNVLVEEEG